ncbi:MAG: hypothetical protein QXJ56_08345, partial [Ignisphaera sp.]
NSCQGNPDPSWGWLKVGGYLRILFRSEEKTLHSMVVYMLSNRWIPIFYGFKKICGGGNSAPNF